MPLRGETSCFGAPLHCMCGCLRLRRLPPQRREAPLLTSPGAAPAAAPEEVVEEDPSWPKVLVLVRHGESTYNVYYALHHSDRGDLFDAPLTSAGEAQARAAAAALADAVGGARVELALTSPLSRAARTCLLALPPGNERGALRYEVIPLLTEHLEASCDIGRTPAELRREFPELDFSALADVWWYVPKEFVRNITPGTSRCLFTEEGRREPLSDFRGRVDAFARLLSKRRERTIAVFAHADFFHELLYRHFSRREAKLADYWMKNCEVLRIEVGCAEDLLHPRSPMENGNGAGNGSAANAAEAPPAQPQAEATKAPNAASQGLAALKREIAAAQPEMKPAELMRAATTRWRALTPEERARYMLAGTGQ